MTKKKYTYHNKLGDYIHLRAENYRQHGTFRQIPGIDDKRTNYGGADLFHQFTTAVYHKAKVLDQIKDSQQLKILQDALNRQLKDFAIEVDKIFQGVDGRSFKEELLTYIVKDFLPNISDTTLNNYLQLLDLEVDANHNIQLVLKTGSNSRGQKIASLPPLPSASKWHTVGVLQDRLDITKRTVALSSLPQTQRDMLLKRCNKIQSYLNGFKRVKGRAGTLSITNKDLMQELNQIIANANGKMSPISDFYLLPSLGEGEVRLSVALGKYLFSELQNIYRATKINEHFMNFSATAAEAMIAGSIAVASGMKAQNVSAQLIMDTIRTNHKGSEKPPVLDGIKDLIDQTAKTYHIENRDSILNITTIEEISKDKVDARIVIDDQVFEANIKEVNPNRIGKNSKINFNDSKTLGLDSVSLVSGTSLNALLLSAENYQQKMGTHFLNALTKDAAGNLAGVRRAAIESLKLFAIYTGLTGGQEGFRLREGEGADIFVVQNKTTKQVTLFSISSILADALNSNFQKNMFYMSASEKEEDFKSNFANIKLRNEWVSENLGGLNARIKNTLLEAHQYKIKVALSLSNYIRPKM